MLKLKISTKLPTFPSFGVIFGSQETITSFYEIVNFDEYFDSNFINFKIY